MNRSEQNTKGELLGLPKALLWGYIAIAFFMTGDGIEQAFLSSYMVTDLGFTLGQASALFTGYGLSVAIGSFISGIFADYFGPKRVMTYAAAVWIVFHVGFLFFGIQQDNYPAMFVLYMIRGPAYPMFIYAFVVWISHTAAQKKLASAMGWFWCMYSTGVGLFGTYLPSFTIPAIGFLPTLWSAILFVGFAGLIVAFVMKKSEQGSGSMTHSNIGQALLKGVTIIHERPQLALAIIVRVINQLSLFGFVVFMPIVFTREVGFTMSQWLQIWGLVYLTTIFTNVMWGVVGDRIGWVRQVKWFGCIGMAIATLLFYYVPLSVGPVFWVAGLMSVIFGFGIAAFVPMSAIFPTMAPDYKGAAVSLHNLSAGLSNFFAPAIATILLPYFGAEGVIWAYAIIYVIGSVVAHFMKVDQYGQGQKVSLNESIPQKL